MKHFAGMKARAALMDGRAHAKILKKSPLDWTIVRGPILTEAPGKGIYQIGYVGKVKGFKLTREDLAAFILSILKNNSHIKEMPFVAN